MNRAQPSSSNILEIRRVSNNGQTNFGNEHLPINGTLNVSSANDQHAQRSALSRPEQSDETDKLLIKGDFQWKFDNNVHKHTAEDELQIMNEIVSENNTNLKDYNSVSTRANKKATDL